MFTELAAAGDLYTYLESHKNRLEDVHARLITRQIALALQYLHSKGIAHRDVKLENVLLSNTDIGARVILTDFGLANYIDQRTGRMFSTVGTEGYAAPEITSIGKSRGYTLAADMWSFGMLTWTLLTGETTVPRGTLSQLEAIQIAREFLSADEELAAQKWSYLSSRVRDFLRRLLATEPGHRMSAAQAVIHPWYKKPAREAKEMEYAYERATRFWKPREAKDILEHIPTHDKEAQESAGVKIRKRLPDASSSPYFSLNRHLITRSPSKRLRVLEELNKSGVQFLAPEGHQHESGSEHDAERPKRLRIRSTHGSDMFGKSIDSKRKPVQQVDSLARPDHGNKTTMSNLNGNSLSIRTVERRIADLEDQLIHNTASEKLPMYCSAKFFKDCIDEVKEQKSKEV
ncbi:hypothetical protein ACMFMG_011156 [Clarireedia jacksonii]